ncbi:acyltransferase [Bradyrhizobium sp. LHD-71]|uniref:acyltransferase family protein n=1 Tax=Bradyrhizobium sp. LHD-71 TaxID=3072141 RepID=UPI00280E4FFE|nr:acyltransferase [Bradyrhizobium sp. LHD-71]MDQ8732396.1 acyltransferase [Bradyrhizobium sp. LHD-71]
MHGDSRPSAASIQGGLTWPAAASPGAERIGCFDLLRLIAALLVLGSHQLAVAGLPEIGIAGIGTFGALGVGIFFAISGYLNTLSIMRSKSATSFLINRLFRIYPALFVCVCACIVLGAFLTSRPIENYLFAAGDGPWRFFWKNAIAMRTEYVLADVFDANHLKGIVNASLWTLPIEIKLYICFAALAWLARFKMAVVCVAVVGLLVGAALSTTVRDMVSPLVSGEALRLTTLFAVGATVAVIEARFGFSRATIAVSLIALLLLCFSSLNWALTFAIPVAAIAAGKLKIPLLTPKMDISYGMYLYAFPVQQLSVLLLGSLWASSAFAVAVTTMAAVLSALFVEQPAMTLRRSFPQTARGASARPSLG